jgi:anti-sigma B factor antagonist
MNYQADESRLTLRFEEDLISTTVKKLLVSCQHAIEISADAGTVVADLSEVEMIDSQGLNLLITLYKFSQDMHKEFAVQGASPANAKLLAFVNLQEKFHMQ